MLFRKIFPDSVGFNIIFLFALMGFGEGRVPSNVCSPATLFKPTITVAKGRNPSVTFSGGPGYYDFSNASDINVCINGL